MVYSLESVQASWQSLRTRQAIDHEHLRPEIAASWRRCTSLPFRPDDWSYRPRMRSEHETAELLRANAQLMSIVLPVLRDLMALVAGSGFIALLTDPAGNVLWSDGDPADRAAMAALHLIPGCVWNEQTVGTCAISMAMGEGLPCQVIGPEHYWEQLHSLTCSAAPIFGPDGQLLAILNLSGLQQRVTSHTLGMVVASARAVERQLQLVEAARDLARKNQELDTSLSLIADGVILLGLDLRVLKMNPVAGALLQIDPDRAVGLSLTEIVGENGLDSSLRTRSRIDAEEWLFTWKDRAIRCLISARPVPDKQGIVLTLRETRDMTRLVQRVRGDQARFTIDDIHGVSRGVAEVRRRVEAAANTSSTVLILGESGTGKELVAHAIHSSSARRKAPFITINCGAIPRNLLESELFGYEPGAFTGASRQGNPGKFELADGGTIFLDEIGEMPLEMQISLLRVLQSREVTRVGGHRTIPVDVRVIAATNRNLMQEVGEGKFRSDLLYRLDVVNILIPPLRDRPEDIPVLVRSLLLRWETRGRSVRFTPAAMAAMRCYPWPGNVREMENVIERCIVLATGDEIDVDDLPESISAAAPAPVPGAPSGPARGTLPPGPPFPDMMKRLYADVWEKAHGDVVEMARLLGVSRATAYRKIKQYGLSR